MDALVGSERLIVGNFIKLFDINRFFHWSTVFFNGLGLLAYGLLLDLCLFDLSFRLILGMNAAFGLIRFLSGGSFDSLPCVLSLCSISLLGLCLLLSLLDCLALSAHGLSVLLHLL
jgi:hypothetical protein